MDSLQKNAFLQNRKKLFSLWKKYGIITYNLRNLVSKGMTLI